MGLPAGAEACRRVRMARPSHWLRGVGEPKRAPGPRGSAIVGCKYVPLSECVCNSECVSGGFGGARAARNRETATWGHVAGARAPGRAGKSNANRFARARRGLPSGGPRRGGGNRWVLNGGSCEGKGSCTAFCAPVRSGPRSLGAAVARAPPPAPSWLWRGACSTGQLCRRAARQRGRAARLGGAGQTIIYKAPSALASASRVVPCEAPSVPRSPQGGAAGAGTGGSGVGGNSGGGWLPHRRNPSAFGALAVPGLPFLCGQNRSNTCQAG